MGNNFDVIEQATFETLLSEHDRAEVRRLLERITTLIGDLAAARQALDEREADMHMRIRADYDKTVADSWRAKVAEAERERDEARAALTDAERERDEARAKCRDLSEDVSHDAYAGDAAAERAKIVAHLTRVADTAAVFAERDDECCARDLAEQITRLDHHRDREEPTP